MDRIIIDWPFPVSVNRIWRGSGKHVYRSKVYTDWMTEAGLLWLTQKKNNKIRHIGGFYSLHITLNPPHKRRIDLGNFEKVVSDLLQHLHIIEDDRFCRRLLMEYGEAPLGARIIVTNYH